MLQFVKTGKHSKFTRRKSTKIHTTTSSQQPKRPHLLQTTRPIIIYNVIRSCHHSIQPRRALVPGRIRHGGRPAREHCGRRSRQGLCGPCRREEGIGQVSCLLCVCLCFAFFGDDGQIDIICGIHVVVIWRNDVLIQHCYNPHLISHAHDIVYIL